MIPIKDSAPRDRFPIVNIALILANVLLFLYQQSLPPELHHQFICSFGTIPAKLSAGLAAFLEPGPGAPSLWTAVLPLITANFLHGGWLHLAGNMLYLWIFGDNIEGKLGHFKYLVLYLFMGAASQLFHIFSDPHSAIPLVGASGAIAGVLGAYFVLYPGARVLTLVPIGCLVTFVRLPAMLFLGVWFILQLFNASLQGADMGAQAVAWWAHVGGFVVGLVIGLLSRKKPREEQSY